MTTTIDFDALQAAQGPKVTLVPSTTVSQAGTGDVFTDFSVFSGVYVTAKAMLRFGSHGQPSLTILVEHSDDGDSWETAATLSWGPDGARSSSVSSPKEFFRVSWSVGGRSEWQIVSVEAAPTYLDAPASPGGSQTVLTATKTIEAAAILTMDVTPVELIAAPGANKYLVPFAVFLRLNTGTEYTMASGNIAFSFDNNNGNTWGNCDKAILTTAPPVATPAGPDYTTYFNNPVTPAWLTGNLVILANGGTPSGGTASLSVRVFYATADLS